MGAGYVMATKDIGDQVSVLPGVRYQNLATKYAASRGVALPGNRLQRGDNSNTYVHGGSLPMVHARYPLLDWLQIHFAYALMPNYPDYGTLTLRYLIFNGVIDDNDLALKPATSEMRAAVLTRGL